jgi:hypothetical protein
MIVDVSLGAFSFEPEFDICLFQFEGHQQVAIILNLGKQLPGRFSAFF